MNTAQRPRNRNSERRSPDQPLRALAWMSLSAVGFSTMAILIKRLSGELPQYELVFFRAFINLLVVFPLVLLSGDPLLPPKPWILIGRGVAGFAGLVCLFYTLARLPLSIAMLLLWCSPVFVILFSRILLKERLSRAQLACIALAFVGVVLLLMPGKGPPLVGTLGDTAIAMGIGLLGAAMSGLAYVAVRAATAHVGIHTIVFYFVAVSSLCSFPLAIAEFQPPTASQWVDLIGAGLLASASQAAMTHSYRFAPAGLVSPMGLLNAGFSAILGWLVFGELLAPLQWLGMAVLAGAILLLTLPTGIDAVRRYRKRQNVPLPTEVQ